MRGGWLWFLSLVALVASSQAFSDANPSNKASPKSIAPANDMPISPGRRIITLTKEAGYNNEPSIAVNSENSRLIVATYLIRAAAAYSRDAGRTWTVTHSSSPPDYRDGADVSVTYDNRGRAFLVYLAFDKLGTENYWVHNATRHGIFVRRSLDGGKRWDKAIATVIAQPSKPGIAFEDKPYIVADATRSPYAGNLYIGWTEFTPSKSVILFSRSTDTGVTWSTPVEISSHEGLPRDETGAVEGFTGAVAADGTLYAAWSDNEEIILAKSQDGGRTFSRSRPILETTASFFSISGIDRANGFPVLGIDTRADLLYVAWADYRNGDVDILAASSADGGDHWTEPVRVNTDAIHNGADQFFPWLAVDQEDGAVNLIFYDRRSDPDNRKCSVTLARSTDGGRTFTNFRWSARDFDPAGAFIGDYLGIAAYDGRVYGIWTRAATKEERKHERKGTKLHLMIDVGIADFSTHPRR